MLLRHFLGMIGGRAAFLANIDVIADAANWIASKTIDREHRSSQITISEGVREFDAQGFDSLGSGRIALHIRSLTYSSKVRNRRGPYPTSRRGS